MGEEAGDEAHARIRARRAHLDRAERGAERLLGQRDPLLLRRRRRAVQGGHRGGGNLRRRGHSRGDRLGRRRRRSRAFDTSPFQTPAHFAVPAPLFLSMECFLHAMSHRPLHRAQLLSPMNSSCVPPPRSPRVRPPLPGPERSSLAPHTKEPEGRVRHQSMPEPCGICCPWLPPPCPAALSSPARIPVPHPAHRRRRRRTVSVRAYGPQQWHPSQLECPAAPAPH